MQGRLRSLSLKQRYNACGGQSIDATLMLAPKQRLAKYGKEPLWQERLMKAWFSPCGWSETKSGEQPYPGFGCAAPRLGFTIIRCDH